MHDYLEYNCSYLLKNGFASERKDGFAPEAILRW